MLKVVNSGLRNLWRFVISACVKGRIWGGILSSICGIPYSMPSL